MELPLCGLRNYSFESKYLLSVKFLVRFVFVISMEPGQTDATFGATLNATMLHSMLHPFATLVA